MAIDLPDLQAGAPRKPVSEQRASLSPEQIRALIAEAAYYRAQQRRFVPGREVEDWIEAESEVMFRLGLWE